MFFSNPSLIDDLAQHPSSAFANILQRYRSVIYPCIPHAFARLSQRERNAFGHPHYQT